MSEPAILYSGIFCFGMILLAATLTIQEFRKQAQVRPKTTGDTRG